MIPSDLAYSDLPSALPPKSKPSSSSLTPPTRRYLRALEGKYADEGSEFGDRAETPLDQLQRTWDDSLVEAVRSEDHQATSPSAIDGEHFDLEATLSNPDVKDRQQPARFGDFSNVLAYLRDLRIQEQLRVEVEGPYIAVRDFEGARDQIDSSDSLSVTSSTSNDSGTSASPYRRPANRKPITLRDVQRSRPTPQFGLLHPTGTIVQPTPLHFVDRETTPLPDVYREPSIPMAVKRIGRLASKLIESFREDEARLKQFVKEPEKGLGDSSGRVIWQDGVGRLVRSETVVQKSASGKKLHLFLDHSNIYNGLFDYAPSEESITPISKLGRRVLSIPNLTLILSRGRPLAPSGMHLVGSSPLAQNLDTAVRLGWECSILKRVPHNAQDSQSRAGKPLLEVESDRDLAGSAESDWTGGSMTTMREQAVDEILQLKILQTILKTNKPGVMVVATGDANRGQYNTDGFLGCVREALKRHWKVELWSFRRGRSRTWLDTAKREGWKGFSSMELDNWVDDLSDWQIERSHNIL